jgi:hypothetical protein
LVKRKENQKSAIKLLLSFYCFFFFFFFFFFFVNVGFLSTNEATNASNAATRTHIVFRDHGNNSHIWFRDESLASEPNRSAVAREREPSLIVALEKLRLTHLQFDTSESSANVGIGEHNDGTWRRQAQISSLWRKVINNGDDIRHVCHIGLGGGFPAVLYLEALPNATVSVFDACQGDDSNRTCDVVEQFLQLNYAADRFRLVRANDVARRLVLDTRGYWPTANAGDPAAAFRDPNWGPVRQDDRSDSYKSHDNIAMPKTKSPAGSGSASGDEGSDSTRRGDKVAKPPPTTLPPQAVAPGSTMAPLSRPCDWIGIDLRGDTDTPSGLLKILRPAVACPNIVFMNNVGHESADEKLTKLAKEWDEGVESRVSMQSHCEPCYAGDVSSSDCTFCYGHFLCGALAAAQEDELIHSGSDVSDDKKMLPKSGSSSVFIRPAAPVGDDKPDPDLDEGESDDSKEVSDESTDSEDADEKQALLKDEDAKADQMH